MVTIRTIVFGLTLFYSTVFAQKNQSDDSVNGNSQILSVLKAEFQKRNPSIDHVELFDVRPLFLGTIDVPERPNHYLVNARGWTKNWNSKVDWKENELFGLFLLDDSLFEVKYVVAFIPTQRLGDFSVKIVKIWKDSVTVRGVERLEETDFVKRYYLLK